LGAVNVLIALFLSGSAVFIIEMVCVAGNPARTE